MTTDIKELVQRLRAQGRKNYGLSADAADALEAMAGEVERLKDRDAINATCHFQAAEINKLETERDRLKAAVTMVLEEFGYSLPPDTVLELRKALGGDAS